MVLIGSAGVLAPGKLRWLRAIGWMMALCVAIVAAFNGVAKIVLLLMTSGQAATAGDKLVAALAGSLAILLLYRLAVGFGERRAVPELGLRRAPMDLLLGLAIGFTLVATIIGLLWAFGWVSIEAKPLEGIALALRDSIRSGVVEELVLRLVILRLLWRAFGIWPAIAIAALLFGALHFGNPDSSLFAIACLIAGEGIVIGLYLITGRIWASIGTHAAWNFTQGWIFGAAVSGTGEIAGGPLVTRPAAAAPGLLSGGGFGPEASLAALVISLLASVACLGWAWKHGRFTAADEGIA
ncbi:MAG: CPBP family intramembrane metalloprotease [Pseudomonadota bacterium]|nr:CPBP family intramembrane metalloprotease [Pseudomonadota bacterium]